MRVLRLITIEDRESMIKKCKDIMYLPICQGGYKTSNFTRKPKYFAYKPILGNILKCYINYCSIRQKR